MSVRSRTRAARLQDRTANPIDGPHLATNGIDKPASAFSGCSHDDRGPVAVDNPDASPIEAMLAAGVKDKPDIHADWPPRTIIRFSPGLALSRFGKPGPPDDTISRFRTPRRRFLVEHYRVDTNTQSYEIWKRWPHRKHRRLSNMRN